MKLEDSDNSRALKAMKAASKIAAENGISDRILDYKASPSE